MEMTQTWFAATGYVALNSRVHAATKPRTTGGVCLQAAGPRFDGRLIGVDAAFTTTPSGPPTD
jgi:hypothetical protein